MRQGGNNRKVYPCMGCEGRYPACHDYCERYAERKQIEESNKAPHDEFGDYLIDKHHRLRKWSKKGY